MPSPSWTISRTFFLLLLVAGCNGGKPSSNTNKLSFDEQYRRARRLSNPESQARQLIQVSLRQNKAGDVGGARRSIEDAKQACQRVEDARGRVRVLNRLANAQGTLGMRSAVRDSVAQVRNLLGKIDGVESKITILAKTAITSQQHLNSQHAASSLLTQAESLVDQLDKKDAQVRALSVIAYAQHRVQAREQADRLIGEAIDRAQRIEDPRRRSDAICEAAAALRMMGKSDDSATMIDKALEAARTIDDNVSQAHALADIAVQLGTSNQKGKAREILAEAERVGDTIGDRGLLREVMEKIDQARGAL